MGLSTGCNKLLGVGAALLALLGACASPTPELTIANPDRASFELEVYPVLLRDCSFHACHGSTDRFFQVFGPGRDRLTPDLGPLDPVTPLEVEHAYQRALSMVDPAAPEQSPLVRKPLAADEGGSGHQGTDSFGRDVYQNTLDPGYEALRRWALTYAAAVPAAPVQPAPGTPPATTGPGQP